MSYPLVILEEGLKNYFDINTVLRGRDYRNLGHVLNYPSVDTIQHRITGRVRGIDREPYSVTVNYENDQPIKITQANCSCPARMNCPHAVALLLEVAYRNSQKAEAPEPSKLQQNVRTEHLKHRPLRNRVREVKKNNPKTSPVLQRSLESKVPVSQTTAWLQAINGVIENEGASDAAKDCSRTAYILRSEPVSNKLYVLVAHRLALKNDNLTTFYASTIGSLKGQPGEPIDDLNQLILTCFPNPANDGLSFFPDDSELSMLLLRRLIATKKCFWKTPYDKPLVLGEARVASFAWRLNQDGKQVLKLSAGSEHSTCAQAGGYFYVDHEVNQIGPLITKLPSNLVSALLSGPPVSTAEAGFLSTKLNASDVGILLVPPKVIPQEQVTVVRPVPRLKLEQLVLRFPHHGPMRRYAAVLTFDYGDWRCHPNSDELVCFKDGKNFVSKRHKDFEEMLLGRLFQLGMKTSEPVVKNAIPVGAVITRFDYPENAQWQNFMTTHAPALAKEGWRIEVDSSFPHRTQVVNCEQFSGQIDDIGGNWFSLNLDIDVDGETLPLLPILSAALHELPVCNEETVQHLNKDGRFYAPLPDGRSIALPFERVRAIVLTLLELFGETWTKNRTNSLSVTQALSIVNSLSFETINWSTNERLRMLAAAFEDFSYLTRVEKPCGLKAELRPYQLQGLSWLQFLNTNNFGGLLADDMGLGKTLQGLAHILHEKESGRMQTPCLIICPTSVVPNWLAETEKFAPDLKVLNLSGANRYLHFADIPNFDLVVSSYALLVRDIEYLKSINWHVVILDEAQAIKNPDTSVASQASVLKANQKLCFTGTPIENHLGELWSQFNFLMPGMLGDYKTFNRLFRTPIEKNGDIKRRQLLSSWVKPFILRRTKIEVAPELPSKTTIIKSVELTGQQRDLYETMRLSMHTRVQEEVSAKGFKQSQIVIFDALLKLRQVCCDPRLVKSPIAASVNESAKLSECSEMVQELVEEGRRILVFSQFTSMLDLIEKELVNLQIPFVTIRGDTLDRRTPVQEFQDKKVPVFLLSLKAGGTGLNLTAADTVIHYDPWWNPAVEDQATDRAYRIGQDKPVFVFKLIASGTVEERMIELQERKRTIARGLLEDGTDSTLPISEQDLTVLFGPGS